MLGIRTSTLRDKADDLPPNENGEYAFKLILEFLARPARDKEGYLVAEQKAQVEAQKSALQVRKLANDVRNQDAAFHTNAGDLVDRHYVELTLGRFADILKAASDQLGRKKKITGKQAQAIVNKAIDKFKRGIGGVMK